MKNFKNILLIALSITAVSCSKQLDINTDPNNPTAIESKVLLPRMEKYLGESLAMGTGFGNNLAAYTHQMVMYGNADQYGAGGNDFYWGQGWDYSYRNVLTNADIIIKQSTASGDMHYVGIAKIIKAYTFSVLVDLFGSVPYSEANKLVEGIKYPKYDEGKDIYPQLIALLDEGIANLGVNSGLSPGADDVIYGGKVDSWIKAANSIKFKLLLEQRKVKDVKGDLAALIASNKLISSTAESFMVPFGPNGATDDRNPGFGEYYASQRTLYVSPWLYEIMKGYNSDIMTSNSDPRIPYYFFNQIKASTGPLTDIEYRDGGFVSMYFGTQGPNKGKNNQNTITVFGIYPVGGRYDDGQGGTASASSGTGAAPYRLITYSDMLFWKAELIQAGLISGDAAATFKLALNESMKMVDYVVSKNGSAQTIPVLATSAAATNFVNKAVTAFNAGGNEKKMELIMTQKWVSNVGAWVEPYNDYRRTGYPVLFDPAKFGGKMTPPSGGNGGDDMPTVPVVSIRKFPNSLPYILDEISKNLNAPAQKTDLSTAKVFWMP
ncbi:SusD/RagB family nutrient-binding outer membrane lipoprotein [Sphingobacterium multivorum]|uniref:SusD/RagB family nutrient-binding outer membrane lipoprotein n=1 Tax=Sphingobacterium multivorum TaxID=28454 RepID=UPI0028B151E7|nr:SusD/RagB family nutrient-binding outer membrane lipoprotein [Sphingobacterium multivorum]